MPDLSHIREMVLLDAILNRVLRNSGVQEHRPGALALNFVRVLDKAIEEYERARAELDQCLEEESWHGLGFFTLIFRASGYLENCINSLHRAIYFAEGLRSHNLRSQNGAPLVPSAREMPALAGHVEDRVRRTRNAIEHVDKIFRRTDPADKSKVLVNPDESVALMPLGDRLQVGSQEILYVELADWLCQLHRLARDIAAFEESSEGRLSD